MDLDQLLLAAFSEPFRDHERAPCVRAAKRFLRFLTHHVDYVTRRQGNFFFDQSGEVNPHLVFPALEACGLVRKQLVETLDLPPTDTPSDRLALTTPEPEYTWHPEKRGTLGTALIGLSLDDYLSSRSNKLIKRAAKRAQRAGTSDPLRLVVTFATSLAAEHVGGLAPRPPGRLELVNGLDVSELLVAERQFAYGLTHFGTPPDLAADPQMLEEEREVAANYDLIFRKSWAARPDVRECADPREERFIVRNQGQLRAAEARRLKALYEEQFVDEWRGRSWLAANGLSVGGLVPDAAVVRDGKIVIAYIIGGALGLNELRALHDACVRHGVGYAVW